MTVWCKAESLQPIGAFKIRGAWTAVRRLPDADRARGVVTSSSGNHGLGVAFAAQRHGIPAVVVMPEDAVASTFDKILVVLTLAIVIPIIEALHFDLIWFGVIGFGVLMYVLLDGFVLGLGILAPFAEDEDQLDLMMNTAAPIWDGNETWLVLGGAGLLAAFPKAYALILSALYLPVLMMLIALVFRGVAFEFRFRAQRAKAAWGVAFSLGSLLNRTDYEYRDGSKDNFYSAAVKWDYTRYLIGKNVQLFTQYRIKATMGQLLKSQGVVAPLASVVQNDMKPKVQLPGMN